MGSVQEKQQPQEERKITQWVSKVNGYSSYYEGWPASNVIGQSNTYPDYGDIRTAWAPKPSKGAFEWLELEYAQEVIPTELHIYETYNPGAVFKISFKDPFDNWIPLWEGSPCQKTLPPKSRIFQPELKFPKSGVFFSRFLRIDMDTRTSASWSEIDAIKLVGFKPTVPPPVALTNHMEDLYQLTLVEQSGEVTPKRQAMLPDVTLHFIKPATEAGAAEHIVVKAHKFILHSRCPTLLSHVTPAFEASEEATITDPCISNQAVRTFMRFLYTDFLKVEADVLKMEPSDQVIFIEQLEQLSKIMNVERLQKLAQELQKYRQEIVQAPTASASSTTTSSSNSYANALEKLISYVSFFVEFTLSQDFTKLLAEVQATPQSCAADVSFSVESKFLHAHAALLAYRSRYFKALFSQTSDRHSLPIENISYASFGNLLEFLYTGKVTVTESNAVELLYAANTYLIEEELTAPQEYVRGNINKENVFDIIQIAHALNNNMLFDASCNVLSINSAALQSKLQEFFKVLDPKGAGTASTGENIASESLATAVQQRCPYAISVAFGQTKVLREAATEGEGQWIKSVTGRSSEYPGWPASNIAGRPTKYPQYGDFNTCWAPNSTSNASREWVELSLHHAVYITGIDIYETYNPGAVVDILIKSETSTWVSIWQGESTVTSTPKQSRIFKPLGFNFMAQFPTQHIRIELDTSKNDSWSEIDAVQVFGIKP